MRQFVALLLVGLLAEAADAQGFTPLGDLPGGLDESRAFAVSGEGTTVVGNSDSSNGQEAFVWTAGGGIVGLGDLPGGGFSSSAEGVSGDGAVVVGRGSGTLGDQPFRWSAGTGLTALGILAGGLGGVAGAASADGATAVGWSGVPPQAVRWDASGVPQGLGFLSVGSFSAATGVSADGSVVVGADRSGAALFEAFVWTAGGGMVGLGVPTGDVESAAAAVSADGSVVVGSGYDTFNLTTGAQAFVWTADSGMNGLGWPAGFVGSRGEAVSADGVHVAGWLQGPTSIHHAALWDASHGWRRLQHVLGVACDVDLSGWQLDRAMAIAAQASTLYVAGVGTNPDGDREGYLAELPAAGCGPASVPAVSPVAIALFALGLGASGLAALSATARSR